jgi:membrane protein
MAPVVWRYFRPPVPWWRVFRRTIDEIVADNCVRLAAQLAFFFLLALFPALLFIVALIGYLPIADAFAALLDALSNVAPHELIALLKDQLVRTADSRHGGLLTLGIGGAIWSSSAAMVAIIDALNRTYNVTEWRPWWHRRMVAILLTLTLALFIMIALALVLGGPAVAFRLAAWFHVKGTVALLWAVIRWPVIVCCVLLSTDLVYRFAPNRRAPWVWITPGSILATALWIVGSVAFKLYVSRVAGYTATYGALGGAIVTMLWFYVSSLAILIGAELNAVIEKAWRSENASDG